MIASVTRPFCGDCDRVRLTADGQVRNCLFAREESDLRTRAARRRDRRGARRALGGRDARQARRPRHRRPDVPPARPADVGHRRLDRSPQSASRAATTSLRKPRAPRKSDSDSRCSSQASQILRRSGVCSFGLFQQQLPRRRAALAALGRADGRPGPGMRCRTTTGEPSGTTASRSELPVACESLGARCGRPWSAAEPSDARRVERRLDGGVGHHHRDVRQQQGGDDQDRPQRSQPWPTITAPTKQTVRMPIEMQVAPLPRARCRRRGSAAAVVIRTAARVVALRPVAMPPLVRRYRSAAQRSASEAP